MSMTVGQITGYLRLVDQGFTPGIRKAQGEMVKTGTAAEAASAKARKGMTGVTKAGLLVGAAAAAGGLKMALSLGKTGIAFNDLQQRSRSSLKVMLGSAQAAEKQLKSLNDFVDNSPFGRDTFIEAQQQMIAFGYKAKDVVPTLSALQDAVAAAGKSDAELKDIVFVMSQIKAAGKITGQDLMQLGQRGVDAAELIGQGLGKSGAQIKKDISAGALDADKALDLLTKGMQKKFAGTADGVKQTWSGVKQRVGAAARGIGSELTAVLVSPVKGGLLVDWANKFADVLFAMKKQIPGVMKALQGAFQGGMDKIPAFFDKLKAKIDGFDPNKIKQWIDQFRNMAPALAPLAGVLGGLAGMKLPMIGAINPLVGGLLAAAAASPELRAALQDLSVELGNLGQTALPVVVAGMKLISATLTPLVSAFNALPGPVKQLAIAGAAIGLSWGKLAAIFTTVKTAATLTWAALTVGKTVSVGATAGLTAFSTAMTTATTKSRVFQVASNGNTAVMTRQAAAANTAAAAQGRLALSSGRAGAAGVAGAAGAGVFGKALAAVGGAAVAVPAALIAGGLGFSAWIDKQRSAVEGAESFTEALEATQGAVTQDFQKKVQTSLATTQLAAASKELGMSQAEMAAAIANGGPALDAMKQKLAALESGTQSHVATGATATSMLSSQGNAWAKMRGELNTMVDEVNGAKSATAGLRAEQERMNAAAAQQAMTQLPQANNQFKLSLLQMKDQLQATGGALRGNSQDALTNRNSILQMAQASMQQYQSMANIPGMAQQAGAAYRSQIANIAQLIPKGREGALAMRQLATQMGMTPRSVRSIVKLDQYEDTMAKLRRLSAQLNKKETARKKVDVSTEEGKRKAKDLDGDIKKIKGKKVKLEADAAKLQAPAERAKKLLAELEKKRTAKIGINDQATSTLTSIKALRDSITDKQVTFTTVHKTKKEGDRATGGPVTKGKTYQVNERGPEIFKSQRDAMVIPGGRQLWTAPESGRIIPASSTKRLLEGTVTGPGTSTSDSILARVSRKEEIIAADNASRNRSALDFIHSGGVIPGFKKGKKSSKKATAAKQKAAERKRNKAELRKNLSNLMFDLPGWRERTASQDVSQRLTELASQFTASGGSSKAWKKVSKLQNATRAISINGKKTKYSYGQLANLQKSNKAALDAAQQTLEQRQSEKLQTHTSLKQSAVGDITGLQNTSGQGIKNWLRKQVEKVVGFDQNLRTLAARGLPQILLDQLINAGMNGVDAAASLVKMKGGDWSDIVSNATKLDTASTNLATLGSGLMHDAGIKAAQGIVIGLRTQQKAIEDEMIRIANSMRTAIKKALGIRSPAKKVYQDITNVPAGAVLALLHGRKNVAKAAEAMVDPIRGLDPAINWSYQTAMSKPAPSLTTRASTPIVINVTMVDKDGSLLGRVEGVANDIVGQLADRYMYA